MFYLPGPRSKTRMSPKSTSMTLLDSSCLRPRSENRFITRNGQTWEFWGFPSQKTGCCGEGSCFCHHKMQWIGSCYPAHHAGDESEPRAFMARALISHHNPIKSNFNYIYSNWNCEWRRQRVTTVPEQCSIRASCRALIMHKAKRTPRQISLLPSVSRLRSIIRQLRKSGIVITLAISATIPILNFAS